MNSVECEECSLACPEELEIPAAMAVAKGGDYSPLEELRDFYVGCRRCEQVCNKDIPILNLIEKAAQKAIAEEKGLVRAGRRSGKRCRNQGRSLNLVMGTTPGVIAIIGCFNYPAGSKDVYNIAEELLGRNGSVMNIPPAPEFLITTARISIIIVSSLGNRSGAVFQYFCKNWYFSHYPGAVHS